MRWPCAPGWPDDTRVELEYMDEGPGDLRTTHAEGDQGPIVEVPFDSGYKVRVYDDLVLLFAPPRPPGEEPY